MGLYRKITPVDNGTVSLLTPWPSEPLKLGEGIRDSKQLPPKIDLQPE